MALRGVNAGIWIATRFAIGAAALALAVLVGAPARAQLAGAVDGLRGTSAPGPGDYVSQAPSGGLSTDGAAAKPPPASYSAGAADVPANAAINYGKPRKPAKLPKPNPTLRPGKPPLPALEPYKFSYAARRRLKNPEDADRPQAPPPTGVAVVPTIAVKAAKKPEENPFDPVGVDIGSLRLRPYVEFGGGYDTNPNRVETPARGSTMGRVDVGTSVDTDWSRHSLKGELRAGYSDFFAIKGVNRPDGAGKLDGKIDVTRDTSIDVGGNFNISTLRPGSPEIQPGSNNIASTNQPIQWSAGGYAGATHRFNRLEVSLRGTVDRNETGDATFSDGSIQKLSLDNYTTLGVKPRISYEISPGLKPFVEATVDRRTYDSQYDVNGYQRNSKGLAFRAGASFEIDGKLKGEASGGYVQRDYEDPRLVRLHGPSVDASLIWTATPLTTVTLRGSTTANETTVPNASGAIARKVSAEISHELLRNLKISGLASYQITSYQGANIASSSASTTTGINERLANATVKAEYSLTRSVVVKASYSYERLKSTVPGSDYTANVFLLGLRLQR